MSKFPGIQRVDYPSLPDGPWSPALLGNSRNARGTPPKRILYLWVFEREASLCGQLIIHGWAFLGPVHLLLSPAARTDGPLLKSAAMVDQAVHGFQAAAGNYRCPRLLDYEYRATYHGYPINYLWCTDKTWQYGFERTAEVCDYFVMDLSADERPDGLITEISYLLQYIPLHRVIFLLDTYGSRPDLVEAFIHDAWAGMAPTAVNAHHREPIPIIHYKSSSLAYLAQASLGLWSGKAKVPLAQRAAQFAGW